MPRHHRARRQPTIEHSTIREDEFAHEAVSQVGLGDGARVHGAGQEEGDAGGGAANEGGGGNVTAFFDGAIDQCAICEVALAEDTASDFKW